MVITDTQKVDFLFKRVIGGVTQTDIVGKEFFNETIASPIPTYNFDVWAEADLIPSTPPTSTGGVVEYFGPTAAVQCTADPTVAGNKTWLATRTFGNINTRIIDWIGPTFDPGYLIQVYDGDPNASGTLLNQGLANNEFVFDYIAGVLHFPNNVQAGATEIWLVGWAYQGQKGLSGSAVGGGNQNAIVADITARDALTAEEGDIVLVEDNGDGEYATYIATTDGTGGSIWQLIVAEPEAQPATVVLDIDGATDSTFTQTLRSAFPNTRVTDVTVLVDSAFDGTPTVEVGDTGDVDRLFTALESDLTATGTYFGITNYVFPTTTNVDVSYTDGGATTGTARVILTFA